VVLGVSVEAEDHLGADRLVPLDLSVEAVIVIVSQIETIHQQPGIILLVEVDLEVLRLEKIISNVMVFPENHKQCL
jgi:tRNA-binding EMAP/Myf-like protein